MLRRLAGASGPAAAAARARLATAVPDPAGWWEAPGLLLRYTGPPPERVGDLTVLVDGDVYAGDPHGALDDLRGDFVLFRWDHAASVGELAADHFGGRSLCYAREGGLVIFG